MARIAKSVPVDLSAPVNLSASVIERLVCPAGKEQAFLRDAMTPGLRVRVSAQGAKTFVVERKVGQKTVRRTIADVRTMDIQAARAEALRIYQALASGVIPEKVQPAPAAVPTREPSVAQAWQDYLAERKAKWGARHYDDHVKMSAAGGLKYKRGNGLTQPGVLHPLMAFKLADLSPAVVEQWAARQAGQRAAQTRLAVRMLAAFLKWCTEHTDYATCVQAGAAKTRKTREALGRAKSKTDALMREQLQAWFAAVRSMSNPTVSAYLQVMLLTGARPSEVRLLRWADVDWSWRGLGINDKVEGARVIPLTPYVAGLLENLPRRNEFVFASVEAESGVISSPNDMLHRACAVAGIPPLTLHGLRRSFKSLTEWLDCPAGVVAQIMGHKPSATAEKHYTVRPLDLLRVYHERIEGWVLEQAGIAVPKTNDLAVRRKVNDISNR